MKELKYILLWILVAWTVLPMKGQKRIDSKFMFEDGVYQTHQDFKTNQPTFALHEIPVFDYKLDGEKNLLFLSDKSIDQLAKSKVKSLDNIWGLCIKGRPYMKVTPNNNKEQVYFVRYYILGSICYLYYPVFQEKTVEMFVHNPYTGDKVGSKTIVNKEKTFIKKLMVFETGELVDYNGANFLRLINKDKRLVKTLKGLTEEQISEKLFKSIRIYNDRNPLTEAIFSATANEKSKK